MQKSRPTVLVATNEHGVPRSPWMWRQVADMSEFDMQIMYWMPADAKGGPLTKVPVHVLNSEAMPYHGKKRWLLRLANLAGGNFYAALGSDANEIKALIKAVNPASILAYYGEVALRVADAAYDLGVPVIAYFHGDFTFNTNRWYRRSLENRLHQFAAVVVVTESERAWMRAHGAPEDRLHVVPCGAPTDVFVPKAERRHAGVRFVMVSRLADEKGCRESLAAFAEVAANTSNVFLDIYGDGPEREGLEKMVETLGLGHAVVFHGHVDERTLAATLPECDVFIQHSLRREGSPVSIVEAMSCCLPVVATRLGGIVDLVIDGSTGFVVAEHDVGAMAQAMKRLAENATLRATMGEQGRKRAVEGFDTNAMTRRLERIVSDVSNSRLARSV